MEPEAVEALRILARVCSQEGRRFALIGAAVPEVVLDFREGSGSGSRETRDVDAVAEVNSWDDFTRLCERLEQDGFRQGQVAHELWFGDEIRIDLIPFGPSLVEHDKLSWPYGDSVMTACGLEEALECARDREIAPDLTLPVVSIPGLILTKVVAYMDRPAERARDLIDILYCFEHYERTAGESRRFDYAGATVDDKEVAYEEAGAYLLGIEVAALAKPGSRNIVQRFLVSIRDEFAPAISQILSEEKRLVDSDDRRSVLYRLFRVFGAGINQTEIDEAPIRS
jgi:predicted nucleotidyltransferase